MLNSRQTRVRLIAVWLVGGGFLLAAFAMAYQYLTPFVYVSEARVRLEKRGVTTHPDQQANAGDNNVSWRSAELKFIHSDAFLSRIFGKIPLLGQWSQRYGKSPLTTNEALLILRSKVHIEFLPNTSLFAIRVGSDDPAETAAIANAIAQLYEDDVLTRRDATSGQLLDNLRDEWAESQQRLADARSHLSDVVLQIKAARIQSTNFIYDPADRQTMERKRAELEADYAVQKQELDQIKGMSFDNARNLLPAQVTNELLNAVLIQLQKSEINLSAARSEHSSDSEEVRHAALAVTELSNRTQQIIQGIVTDKQQDLAAKGYVLDELRNSLARSVADEQALSTNNPDYQQALAHVQTLQGYSEDLHARMESNRVAALLPFDLASQVVDKAETPSEPRSPNRELANATAAAGGGMAILGLIIWVIVVTRPQSESRPRFPGIQRRYGDGR